ncbi:hypothetical protein AC578_5424 [Pseudocercospora eumusae]|uniref:Uncharacterized protein n=1 Tax=Pseudocercospora eumusae TaxID=321146 RepID=A0A139HJX2_9PEZI|nr:hypothetical protein AC578_5424 [Pseudocercospora eumusae]
MLANAMSQPLGFVYANTEDDEQQIQASSRLARTQATQNPAFVFVNCNVDNDEDQKKTSRKLIRSKATAYSHRIAPRGGTKPEVNLRVLRSAETDDDSRRQSSSSVISKAFESSGRSAATLKRGRRSPDPPNPIISSAEPGAGVRPVASISRKRTKAQIKGESSGSDSDRSLSPGAFQTSLPDPTFLDASLRDPFLTYPVRYRKWYGQLLNYWYQVVLPRSSRVIKASRPELEAYTIWSRRQELSEPVLFYTSLFFASGIPVAEGLFPLSAALWLRQKTVKAMQDALGDPARATSIPVILAVGRIALHEHIYGNRQLAHSVHRPAQLRMIEMRGGLANLGLPSTTVQLIVWTDSLLAAETGSQPYFADVAQRLAIPSYTPQEAMRVTNFSSPNRTQHPGYDKEPLDRNRASKRQN